jgi:hypothetical protein
MAATRCRAPWPAKPLNSMYILQINARGQDHGPRVGGPGPGTRFGRWWLLAPFNPRHTTTSSTRALAPALSDFWNQTSRTPYLYINIGPV